MDIIEAIKGRRSIRKFVNRDIERDIICKIAEATVYAPSWKNSQIARYTIIEDKNIIDKIAKEGVLGFEFNSKTIEGCNRLAVQTVIKGKSGFEADGSFSTSKGNGWEMYDAGISAQTFCLAAHSYGVGTVIMGIFDEERVKEIVGVPENQCVTALIAMGYYDIEREAPNRIKADELVNYK